MYVKAGESFTVEVELNWNRAGITKDWSVTAWGESGGVSVAHDEGYKTDSFPFTPKKGSRTSRKYSPRPEVYAPPKAGQGEVCEGLNESRGQPFPSCKDGL